MLNYLIIAIILGVFAWLILSDNKKEYVSTLEYDIKAWDAYSRTHYDIHPIQHTNHVTKCCMNCGVSDANENYLCKPCSKLSKSKLIFNQ